MTDHPIIKPSKYPVPSKESTNKHYKEVVGDLVNIIKAKNGLIKPKDIIALSGYSKTWVRTAFKHVTGTTVQNTITKIRLKYGIELMSKNITLTEISEELNFSTPTAFCHLFRAHFNINPQEYRKLYL